MQTADQLLYELKSRACRAHELCNQLRLKYPEIAELGDDGELHDAIHDILRVDTPTASHSDVPIPMILHCPSCGMQHIDAPETHHLDIELDRAGMGDSYSASWNNPPHRSHLCHGCGTIWRPADVPTVGVASIKTKGKEDRIVPAQEKEQPVEISSELTDSARGAVENFDRKIKPIYPISDAKRISAPDIDVRIVEAFKAVGRWGGDSLTTAIERALFAAPEATERTQEKAEPVAFDEAVKRAGERACGAQTQVPRDLSPEKAWEWMAREMLLAAGNYTAPPAERVRVPDGWNPISTCPYNKLVVFWVPEFEGWAAGEWKGIRNGADPRNSGYDESFGIATPLTEPSEMQKPTRRLFLSDLPTPTHWRFLSAAPEADHG